MNRRFKAIIHGRVQGVGFRFFARQAGNELGVTGYVRNTLEDTVEVVAEGEEGLLERFLRSLEEGPSHARVTSMNVSWSEPTGEFPRFIVRA